MVTRKQQDILDLYSGLMEEAKLRIGAIESAINGDVRVPSPIIREFCYLQLRMLCELIALGCLVAHGDMKATQTKRLRDQSYADRILSELETLHADFYPEPAVQNPNDPANIIGVKSGYLTKTELPTLYGKCGDVLHRGNLKKLLKPKNPIQKNFPDVVEWTRKIHVLLRMHVIGLFDGKMIICMLRDANNSNRVQVALAEPGAGPESLVQPDAQKRG